jgi:hypothetical protein
MHNIEEGLEDTVLLICDALRLMPPDDRKYSQEALGYLLKDFWSTGYDAGKGLFEKDIEIINDLMDAYRTGNRSAISETVTGGSSYRMVRERELIGFDPWNIFHNETIVNHLVQIKRDYLRFKRVFDYTSPTPFFERLERLAGEYSEIAIQMKSDIFADPAFRKCYEGLARGTASREDVRVQYLDEEFKRRKSVAELLDKLHQFYGVANLFVEKILEKERNR